MIFDDVSSPLIVRLRRPDDPPPEDEEVEIPEDVLPAFLLLLLDLFVSMTFPDDPTKKKKGIRSY